MGLYNGVTGSGNKTPERPCSAETQLKGSRPTEPEPIEFE